MTIRESLNELEVISSDDAMDARSKVTIRRITIDIRCLRYLEIANGAFYTRVSSKLASSAFYTDQQVGTKESLSLIYRLPSDRLLNKIIGTCKYMALNIRIVHILAHGVRDRMC